MNDDKLSVKHLLFAKAMPNYVPTMTEGYKLFSCTDCGDRFLFQSSYDVHVNRKSVKITYMCRHCGKSKVFNNRCNLLSHIRSHTFKTATINVSDLQIDPLPINLFSSPTPINKETPSVNAEKKQKQQTDKHFCFECKGDINITGVLYKDRAKHYMHCTNQGIVCYTCPVCQFTLPSSCALKAHLRVHLRQPPYFCPECGIHLPNKSVIYPYSHDCEGFKMIRATTRLKCYNKGCDIFHPNDYRDHMQGHVKKVFKCPICSFKWFDEPPQTKHSLCNNGNINIVCYFKCPLCPIRPLSKSQFNRHLSKHFEDNVSQFKSLVYPCRTCSIVFNQVQALLIHQANEHDVSKRIIESFVGISNSENKNKDSKAIYRVLKRCERCQRSFTYRCPFDGIKTLPTRCPYQCSITASANIERAQITQKSSNIICFICKCKINEKWKDIKIHFAKFHRSIKCVDVKLVLNKLSGRPRRTIKKSKKQNPTWRSKNAVNSNLVPKNFNSGILIQSGENCSVTLGCKKCGSTFESKNSLESHMVSHRDSSMAYQCLECGQCFAVKPSFTTHLLLEHSITDVDMYINEKNCYNESALKKNESKINIVDEPIEENQCKICRDKFESQEILEKHFRVHGMAFLMSNSNKAGSP